VLVSLPGRLRAPQANGAVLAEPPLEAAGHWIAVNRENLEQASLDILGRTWSELRQEARGAALDCARSYLQAAGEPLPEFRSHSILMAGHQPELFHPGVWVKNFALNGLSLRYGTTPINLVVDNDTAKSTVLRLPDLSTKLAGELPHIASIPFDRWAGEIPYEERTVHDEPLFESLPERTAEFYQNWGFEPFLTRFWEETRRQASRTSLLGERLAASRRTFERLWHCRNLELPVSHVCRTEPFAWFACHLLAELPRFHAVYNACVHAFRRRHGIRSRNHPVPNLGAEQDWLEVPFWAWKSGPVRRGRLMARRAGSQIEMLVKQPLGNEGWPAIPLQPASAMIRAWMQLERSGFKIRSRALTNTLFARLFIADLFIHGIGGGKYDELTDDIIRQFYGLQPPAFLLLSATLLLPLPTHDVDRERCRRLGRELRDLYYNPQRHLDGQPLSPGARELVKQKESWIARQPASSEAKRERFLSLRHLTARLRSWLPGEDDSRDKQLAECERELQANAILQRRDYPFCLYPEPQLRDFCTHFLDVPEPQGKTN
jgi:hypothetical protein